MSPENSINPDWDTKNINSPTTRPTTPETSVAGSEDDSEQRDRTIARPSRRLTLQEEEEQLSILDEPLING